MTEVAAVYDAMKDYDLNDDTIQFLAEDEFVYGVIAAALKGKTLIDFGCGTGRALQWLIIPPDKYYGYDVSGGMLDKATVKFPHYRFALRDMRNVEPVRGAVVISLYGSPCYMPVEEMADLMMRWHRSELFFLVYGHGRNMETYEARQESGKLHPVLYGKSELARLRKLLPSVDVNGVDIYRLNKFVKDVPSYVNLIKAQFTNEAWPIEEFAWVMLHVRSDEGI